MGVVQPALTVEDEKKCEAVKKGGDDAEQNPKVVALSFPSSLHSSRSVVSVVLSVLTSLIHPSKNSVTQLGPRSRSP